MMRISPRFLKGISTVVLALSVTQGAIAQNWPDRPITMILPAAAGTPSDMVGRLLGRLISDEAGVAVVPDNKPGANGVIGVRQALSAPADAHTLLFTTMSTMALNRYLFKSLPYDAQEDFVPIGIMFRSTLVLVVNQHQPFDSLEGLVAFAKENPGKLNFGYATTVPQLAGSLFSKHSQTEFTFVPYKEHTAMLTGLMGGEIDLSITDTASTGPFTKSGRLRALASTASKRLAANPDLATMRESGVDYEFASWHGLFVRKGTPQAAIDRLIDIVKKAPGSKEIHDYLEISAIDHFLLTGDDAAAYLAQEVERWRQVTQSAGIVMN